MTRRPTQNERILELLADGRWHTTREILATVPCIVHSRIAEINARGRQIEHRGGGAGAENHEYRLTATSEPGKPGGVVSRAVSASDTAQPSFRDAAVSFPGSGVSVTVADGCLPAEPETPTSFEQLTLVAAA